MVAIEVEFGRKKNGADNETYKIVTIELRTMKNYLTNIRKESDNVLL